MFRNPFIPGFELVLASQSPRRGALLTQAGFPFTTRPSMIAEQLAPGETARQYVARLAAEKATAVPRQDHEGVLAADTTVVVAGAILEKPNDAGHAAEMLRALSGRSHEVLTGICLQWQGQQWSTVEETVVHFAALSNAEIEAYVASGEPFDKAGGYGIQGLASKFVSRIEGCYFNVMGLPLYQLQRVFQAAGVLATAESPSPVS